jgi:hypothetical protein
MDHQRPAGVSRPRVLITHRYFWPEDLSLYPLMLKDIAEWHVRQGHEVTVFTASASTLTKQTQRRLWAADCGIHLQEVALPIDRGRSILPRLWAVATYARRLWRVVRSEEANLIIAGTTPPIVPGLVTRLAKRRDAKFLYYVQDIAPEMLAASGRWFTRSSGKLLSMLDRRTVDTADATITISEEMRSTLRQRPKATGNLHSVSNYVIDAAIGRKPPLRGERPRLLFAGNQGKLQNLPHFLRAVAIAIQSEAFDVDIVGAGSEHHRLRTLASELGLSNVTFHGQVARDAAQDLIAASDVGVVAAAPGLYRVAYPSKINSYLIGGLPSLVFADSGSPIDRWLADNEFGMTACPTDTDLAAESIVRIVGEVRAGRYSADYISQRASELLSARAYFNDYQAIVDPLLQAA